MVDKTAFRRFLQIGRRQDFFESRHQLGSFGDIMPKEPAKRPLHEFLQLPGILKLGQKLANAQVSIVVYVIAAPDPFPHGRRFLCFPVTAPDIQHIAVAGANAHCQFDPRHLADHPFFAGFRPGHRVTFGIGTVFRQGAQDSKAIIAGPNDLVLFRRTDLRNFSQHIFHAALIFLQFRIRFPGIIINTDRKQRVTGRQIHSQRPSPLNRDFRGIDLTIGNGIQQIRALLRFVRFSQRLDLALAISGVSDIQYIFRIGTWIDEGQANDMHRKRCPVRQPSGSGHFSNCLPVNQVPPDRGIRIFCCNKKVSNIPANCILRYNAKQAAGGLIPLQHPQFRVKSNRRNRHVSDHVAQSLQNLVIFHRNASSIYSRERIMAISSQLGNLLQLMQSFQTFCDNRSLGTSWNPALAKNTG